MDAVSSSTESPDRLEHLGRSLVQHGPENDRVYLMHLDMADYPVIVSEITAMAERHGYSKIFAKIPGKAAQMFLDSGFKCEARATRLFNIQGEEDDALFLGRFLSDDRSREQNPETIANVLQVAERKAADSQLEKLSGEFSLRPLTEDDTKEMARIYGMVFPTYPFPIHDPAFLQKCMRDNVRFVGAIKDGRTVALASAEIFADLGTAEMTDFATMPEYTGHKLAQYLLADLENRLRHQGITTAFTIARAVSYGMNITFARAGYSHAGTLVNNTNISGGIESMNVWHKSLASSA